jgi:hypothetical protein
MKLKVKTPERIVVGFTRRELLIIGNCLNEACHGLLIDRFIPARDELLEIMDNVRSVTESGDFFKISRAAV